MPNGNSDAHRDAERDARGWIEYYKEKIIKKSPGYNLPPIDTTKEDNLNELRDHAMLLSEIFLDLKKGCNGLDPVKKFKNLYKYNYEFWTGDGSFISTIKHCKIGKSSKEEFVVEFYRLLPTEKKCFKKLINQYIEFKLRRYEGPITYTESIKGVLSKVKKNRIIISQ